MYRVDIYLQKNIIQQKHLKQTETLQVVDVRTIFGVHFVRSIIRCLKCMYNVI